MPSPQRTLEVHAPPVGGQSKFGSLLQTPVQPSPGSALPSSHTSVPFTVPSPQYGPESGSQVPPPPTPDAPPMGMVPALAPLAPDAPEFPLAPPSPSVMPPLPLPGEHAPSAPTHAQTPRQIHRHERIDTTMISTDLKPVPAIVLSRTYSVQKRPRRNDAR